MSLCGISILIETYVSNSQLNCFSLMLAVMFALVFKNNHFMFAMFSCLQYIYIYIYIYILFFKTYLAVVMLLNPIIIKKLHFIHKHLATSFLQQYLVIFFFMCINFGDIFETVLQ